MLNNETLTSLYIYTDWLTVSSHGPESAWERTCHGSKYKFTTYNANYSNFVFTAIAQCTLLSVVCDDATGFDFLEIGSLHRLEVKSAYLNVSPLSWSFPMDQLSYLK